MNVIEFVNRLPLVKSWQADLENKAKRQLLIGLSGSAKALVMAATHQANQKQTVVVVPNLYYSNQLAEELRQIVDDVHLFPVDEVLSAEMAFASPEARAERVSTLQALSQGQKGLYVVPVAALRKFLPTAETWQANQFHWQIGSEVDLEHLAQQLVLMGYERQTMVGKPGEFSMRGNIVDVYPLTTEYPVRMELFDVEIDSLRYFEPETQRSVENLAEVWVTPTTDLVFSKEDLTQGAEKANQLLQNRLVVTKEKADYHFLNDYFGQLITSWEAGIPTEQAKYYTDLLYEKKVSLLDHFAKDALLFVDDYPRMMETHREMEREEAEWHTQKIEEMRVFSEQTFGMNAHDLIKKSKLVASFFSLFQKGMGNLRFEAIHNFQYRSMQQFFGQMPLLKTEVDRWQKQEQTVLFLVSDSERQEKLTQEFQDVGIKAVQTTPEQLLIGQTQIVTGSLTSGFELPQDKLVVVTEREIFQKVTKKRARRQTISNAERLKSYNELKPGDYVVHANHGIGKYIGMETIEIDGVHQDYMSILYQKDDKLFIPVTQLNLIQKYVSSEAKPPKVNKLGGSEWTKTKSKVSKKIEDIADDLIELYAKREAERGYAFGPDDEYQKEFEDAFPYSETDDQLRSTAEIKHDMERARPMDRLLVGDVGFGKTEVALRAAFKAVKENKQVAFLVPTTILAQQHLETMTERFENFPVNIAMLSRFRTKKQQNETIEQIRTGQVDIVVGTHRLLSKDLQFADLGLLVIDEEQRFGVKHKERLKQLRSQVDVLTLTATPIPRTLHMSMLGVRDLSVIETPPENRYPIQTYVMETNPGAIREAIEREMARGGQVFYLYNRVETIERKVEELQMLVPDAKIGFAHGQMTEVQLENTLMDFIDGQYDILVTTTIIETGVDIPNVNTLFVENADYMGLSTLYQLRGRVGRSNRIAYAYFMYEPQKILNEVSEKRLQAIKDFTELGSGFKIAMRDLSIRGAGNLLGAQQHGFIDAVGFDMYSQMLSEAVDRKQGKNTQIERTSVEINLGIDAYIPGDYIEDERQKIEIYKRIRELESTEMLDEVEADLVDRFGDYPDEVANLLNVGQIKMDGDRALVESIQKRQQQIIFTLSKVGTKAYKVEQLFEALGATKMKATLGVEKDQMVIKLMIAKTMDEAVWLREISLFVRALREQKYKE
ncbi:transcription-repair coupling factor [Enterococcus dongliensis]|uniref:Transcription-repair-coupling factor n=1 Tax=Enterococcus dongliensis TaxID=2559925 RepID=A0AAP5NIP3_9ENTE|nr:transcription-repair coupling factor [Enterococcus dongliensis]MDT2596452.1 transcription-repair coupling factor [Enterococcus dongliensis]MDT2604074.1 transcription-repair coupling factor [Enterococcus dongliensis]MDT2634494.1 transcription-repair coupling factor [Enterococcus dongliensis]MDT2636444.1 transcription-repair coupling factor [Enterococcus dongliensis]MDT2640533.1 transcription-repair coupling factor [Enterococcus dongliensis]